jgi:very-short-patch-repair endonuclease
VAHDVFKHESGGEGVLMRWTEAMTKEYEERMKRLQEQAKPKVTVRTHSSRGRPRKTDKAHVSQLLLADLKMAGLPAPELEYRFCERKWRFDLAWKGPKIAVEIEGGIWINGRHNRGSGFEKDMEKYNTAQLLGWTVLRYSTGQVRDGLYMADLTRALKGN